MVPSDFAPMLTNTVESLMDATVPSICWPGSGSRGTPPLIKAAMADASRALASASSAAASIRGPVGFVLSLRTGAASWAAPSGEASGDDSAACWAESGLAAPFFRRIVRMRSDMEHLGTPPYSTVGYGAASNLEVTLLVLTHKEGEVLQIGSDVHSCQANQGELGALCIDAPRDVKLKRLSAEEAALEDEGWTPTNMGDIDPRLATV